MRSAVLVLALAATCLGQSTVRGVILRDVLYDPGSSTLSFVLINQSSKHVVAWSLRESLILPGQPVRQLGNRSAQMAMPPLDRPSPLPKGHGPLVPNEIRKMVERYAPLPEAGERRLELLAVVYEDGTTEGDPAAVKQFLDRRNSEQSEAKKWLPRIEALATAPDLRAAARQLHNEMLESELAAEKALFDNPNGIGPFMESKSVRMNMIGGLRGIGNAPEARRQAALDQYVKQMQQLAERGRP